MRVNSECLPSGSIHPWVRWEGAGSEFDSLSAGTAGGSGTSGVLKSSILLPFGTAWLITGQKFQGAGLNLKGFILSFWIPSSLLCQQIMNVAV